MITPTVGRVLWYYPGEIDDSALRSTLPVSNPPPLAAMVCFVHSDEDVNLVVFDRHGRAHGREHVFLPGDGVSHPPPQTTLTSQARWMPYQLGQAARTEKAEAQAGVRN